VILVDTNVVVDILAGDPRWGALSTAALDAAAARDKPAIDDIVYAELAAGYANALFLETALAALNLPLVRIPVEALFLAGHAFRRYRHSGGTRSNVLADFFIGAHAAVAGAALLTRDTKRVRAYFPTVKLIEPGGP
jgi:predicted nucleic acid-binding protein